MGGEKNFQVERIRLVGDLLVPLVVCPFYSFKQLDLIIFPCSQILNKRECSFFFFRGRVGQKYIKDFMKR